MLTERIIRDAKPGPKPRILWDREQKGLGVKVQPGGTKSFVLDYRVGGRQRRVMLARCSEIGLREARDRAGRELAAIRVGEADPLSRRREASEALTVAELVERFLTVEGPARIERGRMTESTLAGYRHHCAKYLLPKLGKKRVADVKRGDVEHLVAPLPGVTRNRVLALVSRLFGLAERWEWRAQHDNPARGIERAREEPRDRVLAPSELSALAAALDELEGESPAAVAAIRVAALTGLRIGEVLAMRWERVDFESGRLTMPATKTGRRVHDLPAPALETLAAMPRLNDWCFTTGRASLTYKTARNVFVRACRRASLADVRLHDLRRGVMTAAAAAGVGTHILRDLLGHKTTAMADRYVRAVGNPVREAREQIGATMAAMMDGNERRGRAVASGRLTNGPTRAPYG